MVWLIFPIIQSFLSFSHRCIYFVSDELVLEGKSGMVDLFYHSVIGVSIL